MTAYFAARMVGVWMIDCRTEAPDGICPMGRPCSLALGQGPLTSVRRLLLVDPVAIYHAADANCYHDREYHNKQGVQSHGAPL